MAAWDRILANVEPREYRERLKSLFPEPDFDEHYQFSYLQKAILGLTNRSIESILDEDSTQLDYTDCYGRTALSWAACRGDDRALQLLLIYSPDCEKSDHNGSTPLSYAVTRSIQCTKQLVEANADIHTRTKVIRATLIHKVMSSLPHGKNGMKRLEVVVKAGIDVNAQNVNGQTALHYATYYPQFSTESASYLMNHGADPDAYDNRGNSLLSNATRTNCHDLTELLLQKYHLDHTRRLDEYGTFMHIAAEFADARTLRLLAQGRLERRNTNAKNSAGLRPDQIALQRRDVDAEWRDAFSTFLRGIDKDIEPAVSIVGASVHSLRQEMVPEAGEMEGDNASESDDSTAEFVDALEFLA